MALLRTWQSPILCCALVQGRSHERACVAPEARTAPDEEGGPPCRCAAAQGACRHSAACDVLLAEELTRRAAQVGMELSKAVGTERPKGHQLAEKIARCDCLQHGCS